MRKLLLSFLILICVAYASDLCAEKLPTSLFDKKRLAKEIVETRNTQGYTAAQLKILMNYLSFHEKSIMKELMPKPVVKKKIPKPVIEKVKPPSAPRLAAPNKTALAQSTSISNPVYEEDPKDIVRGNRGHILGFAKSTFVIGLIVFISICVMGYFMIKAKLDLQ